MNEASLLDFLNQLAECIKGDVFFDKVTRGIYATDASIYQLEPIAVVLPKDESDVCSAVKIAAKHNVKILPRGGGTSLGGQCVNAAMVIDFSKYMNKVLELNIEEKWVRVQPGIVLDELNATLAKHGFIFAPDPATGSRATLGGMLGNNSSGTRSVVYGITQDHVVETKVLLSDGTVMKFGELTSQEYDEFIKTNRNSRQAQIYSGLKKIIEENRDEITKRFPKVMRSVQGYNLNAFSKTDRWNLSELMVGSEGTLGLFLEAKLKLEPLPKYTALCTVHFSELSEAISTVAVILKHKPSAVEIIDADVIARARENLSIAPLCDFVEGEPKSMLVVEFFGDTQEEADEKGTNLAADLNSQGLGYAWPVISEPALQAKVWEVRKNGLGLLQGMKGDRKPLPFIEDCCLPIEVMGEYIDLILKFCKSRDVPVIIYAHASVGAMHVRPVLNLKDQNDIDSLKAISEYAFELVSKYGGAWSGEHGDGRVRSPFLERFFGGQIYNAFRDVKKLFDPANLMNPGTIVDPNPMDSNLRYGIDYKTPNKSTAFHYREYGSFAAAVEMCTGIGTCRQTLSGTMCPSYRVTRDEEHSTRGRANALRLAMTGQLGPEGMRSKGVFDVLDLCLSCKSCKSECPSNVDMAKLKAEFMQKYYDANGFPLRERLIANSGAIAKIIAGPFAPIVNIIQKTMFFRKALEAIAGFDSRRVPPEYAREPFPKWFKNRSNTKSRLTKRVVLFDDTFMNYHQPMIGISAVELLESCGYEVILANAGCCQRPKMAHGFLREAKTKGEKTLRNLDKYIQQGLKIVVCEPGCCSSLIDDLPDLIDDEQLGCRMKGNVMMLDTFLATEVKNGSLKCEFTSPFKDIIIHGHCHQKALFGTTAMKYLFDMIPGTLAEEIDSGCCGMAGSFGYEKEHYDISMQIGSQSLFPAIRNKKPGAAIVACGFSCRHQIADATGEKSLHWVETIKGANIKQ